MKISDAGRFIKSGALLVLFPLGATGFSSADCRPRLTVGIQFGFQGVTPVN